MFDIGVGEDLSFSLDFIASHASQIFAIDPTPRSKLYVNILDNPSIVLLQSALSHDNSEIDFYFPSDDSKVSGSLLRRTALSISFASQLFR